MTQIFHNLIARQQRVLNAKRLGGADPLVLLIVASFAMVFVLVFAGFTLRGEGPLASSDQSHGPGNNTAPLRLYCAAGLRKPTEAILDEYEAAYRVKVDLHTHGSGTLFGQLRTEALSGTGPDLYLTAEASYAVQGRELGLLKDVIPIGTQRPVVIVAAGNPKRITSFKDFVDPARAIDFGIANEGAAVGKKTREIARALGILSNLESMRKTEQETVVALADAVKLGSLDAAMVWDTTAMMTDGVDMIPAHAPAFEGGISSITICVTSATDRPAEALRLARFIAARNKGLKIYRDYGFETEAGDVWDERPDAVLYRGSMFEPARSNTLEPFNRREGVTTRSRWAVAKQAEQAKQAEHKQPMIRLPERIRPEPGHSASARLALPGNRWTDHDARPMQ